MRMKTIIVAVAVACVAYLFILPSFLWPASPPRASVSFPAEWRHDQDMPLNVSVSTWHPNYKMTRVRFYVDVHESQLDGATRVFYPVVLLQEEPPAYMNRLTLNRFSFPRRGSAALTVPFSTLAHEGVSGPGVIQGHLDVEIVHAGYVGRYSSVAGREDVERGTQRLPFRIELR